MGQAQSRHERPGGFWRRRKPQAATSESPGQMPSPPRQIDQKSVQIHQSSARVSMLPTIANPTLRSVTPFPTIVGSAMAGFSKNKADEPSRMETDKAEQQASSPWDQPMTDAPNKPNKPEMLDAPDVFGKLNQPDQPDQLAQPATPPTQPSLKREFTPPHRIKIWGEEAWMVERRFSELFDEIRKSLNQTRRQQVFLNHKRPRNQDRKLQLDIYKACDSCTLSIEHLVGHFSTRFFHHQGPEDIMGMMAGIDADTAKIDNLRQGQMRLTNYGYNLERAVNQTERHIRELAELAKRIKEDAAAEAKEEEMEESEDYEEEDEYMDAKGDPDPEFAGNANGNRSHS